MIATELKKAIRIAAEETNIPIRDLIEASRESHNGTDGGGIGLLVWKECHDRGNSKLHALPGWPECECTACGCSESATQTDDSGVPVCDACSSYTLDDDGQVVCSRNDICEECGESRLSDALDAGGNSAVRLTGCACERATELAEEDRDEDGDWGVLDMDGRIESGHSTEAGAEAYCAHAASRFAAYLIDTHQASSTAYQPRSVVDLTKDYSRDGQFSTSWSNR